MRLSHKILIPTLLMLQVTVNAQFRPAKCEVQPLWVGGGVRSSNVKLMGTFEKDRREGEIMRSFNLKDTNLVATVGVDYESDYSKNRMRSYKICLAITVSDMEQKKVFESVDSSEARTLYRKRWNLSVTRNVLFDNRM